MTDKVCQNDRIIDMAASIIRDENRLSVHDLTRYPEMDEVENSNMIPDSLRRFLQQMLDPKGKNTDVVNTEQAAHSHSPLINFCLQTKIFCLTTVISNISVHTPQVCFQGADRHSRQCQLLW